MHIPEDQLRAYLTVFMTEETTESVLDDIALRAIDEGVTDPLQLFVFAHEALSARVRLTREVEADVLEHEAEMTDAQIVAILGPRGPVPSAVTAEDASSPQSAVRDEHEPTEGESGEDRLSVVVPSPRISSRLAVRVSRIRDAARASSSGQAQPGRLTAAGRPPESLSINAPSTELRGPLGAGGADSVTVAADVEAVHSAADSPSGNFRALTPRHGKPLVPRWMIVAVGLVLVAWLSTAVLSEAGRERFALLGLDPGVLLLAVAGPILAGYAFLRAGDELSGRPRDLASADEAQNETTDDAEVAGAAPEDAADESAA